MEKRTKKYFEETSLHGFRYITDPTSSKFKSYFWTFICIISTGLCIVLINSQFQSYYNNRITTTIASTSYPIWEVPFPAVTLCNLNVVYKDKMDNLKAKLEHVIDDAQLNNFFTNLSSLIVTELEDKNINYYDYRKISYILEAYGYNTEALMREMAQPCEKLISSCYWNAKPTNCSSIFKQSKTNSGFCCSFNYKEMSSNLQDDEGDKFVDGVGPSFGLSLHIKVEEDQYISPTDSTPGVDVSIHESMEYPDLTLYSATLHTGNDLSLSVKPEITVTDPAVRSVDITTRKCAFPNEIKMEWSNSYTYNTCINECKAKVIIQYCNCIPFYSPITGHSIICNCYPQCDRISYTYQLDLQNVKTAEVSANDSILRVYFGHVSCTKLVTSVFFTWELILASVGGLIGLCLGGSILSIIELFYHTCEGIFSRYSSPRKMKKRPFKPTIYWSELNTFSNKAREHNSVRQEPT